MQTSALNALPRWSLAPVLLLLIAPLTAAAQGMHAPSPIAAVIEQREALELTAEQVARLEAFHVAATERSAQATARVGAMREEMRARAEAMREERAALREEGARAERMRPGAPGRMAPRMRMEGERPGADPEMREAMETLQRERRAAVAELQATLTVRQMQEFQRLWSDDRPRQPRGAMMRTPAFRMGFGAGFLSGQRVGHMGARGFAQPWNPRMHMRGQRAPIAGGRMERR